jgi:hypothetical protein
MMYKEMEFHSYSWLRLRSQLEGHMPNSIRGAIIMRSREI